MKVTGASLIFGLCYAVLSAADDEGPEPWEAWPIGDITAELRFQSPTELSSYATIEGMGWYLAVSRRLKEGEFGWAELKLDVPESWAGAQIGKQGDTILISVTASESYFVAAENVRAVSDSMWENRPHAGYLSESELEAVWNRWGKGKPNQSVESNAGLPPPSVGKSAAVERRLPGVSHA